MRAMTGGCHCGNIAVEMELPRAARTYSPRACDCDFCRKHGAAYVSDPQGCLRVRIRDGRDSGTYRQGSEIADCLFCRNCGVLVGAIYRSEGKIYGVVNANVVDSREQFGAQEPVSPKKLSAGEKAQRWKNLWFSDIVIVNVDTQPR